MSTEVTTSPVAKLYKEAYTLGVEHHSTSQMPKPREDFYKNYTVDDELLVSLDELYSVYRKGYRSGAAMKINGFTMSDLTQMQYATKLDYIKADPRFLYVGAGGFCYKNFKAPKIDEAYLYTQRFLENGLEN